MVTSATQATVYEPVPGWPAIPHPMSFGEATSVAVDRQDRVYVFNRGHNPMMIFDRDGKFVDTWGAGQFQRAHGVYVAPDGNLFLVDDLDHVVKKTTTAGEVLMILGTPGQSAAWQQGGIFNRPTDAWVSPVSGDLFVSDGYGNSRVHRFEPDGGHVLSWGEPGSDPGQFSLPHHLDRFERWAGGGMRQGELPVAGVRRGRNIHPAGPYAPADVDHCRHGRRREHLRR